MKVKHFLEIKPRPVIKTQPNKTINDAFYHGGGSRLTEIYLLFPRSQSWQRSALYPPGSNGRSRSVVGFDVNLHRRVMTVGDSADRFITEAMPLLADYGVEFEHSNE